MTQIWAVKGVERGMGRDKTDWSACFLFISNVKPQAGRFMSVSLLLPETTTCSQMGQDYLCFPAIKMIALLSGIPYLRTFCFSYTISPKFSHLTPRCHRTPWMSFHVADKTNVSSEWLWASLLPSKPKHFIFWSNLILILDYKGKTF